MTDRIKTVDMSDLAVVLDCYRRLNVAYKELKVENEKLREALQPFAYYASLIPEDISDTCSASGTVGDLRAAAAAMRESGDE